MECRHELINYLISKFNYKTYLEIGYKAGATFNLIDCKYKRSVDPMPENECIYLYKLTSDNFFKINNKKYDIIFIDGLHEYEQVKKDFENSLLFLNDNGVIVFHDMNPQDTICKDGRLIKGEVRAEPFSQGGCYNGDCYKLAIDMFNGKYDHEYKTLDMDEGCMIVFPYKKIIAIKRNIDKNYINFDENRNKILNLINAQDFIWQ
jgi:hypothetical protein